MRKVSHCACQEGYGAKTHLGEGVQHIPVSVILVDDGYKGSYTFCSKSLSDYVRDAFISRCGVCASDEQVVFARRDLINQRICESAAKKLGRKGEDTYVLHMNDEQPLLMHLIERFPLLEHQHCRSRQHRQEHDRSDKSSPIESMSEGDDVGEGISSEESSH